MLSILHIYAIIWQGDNMEYNGETIGYKARMARINKNIKQSEIADHLGMHQTTYSRFENGTHDIDLFKAIKLCNYFDIKLSWLVDEEENDFTLSEQADIERYKRYIRSIRKN
jgi:transcriptional regulator with XRE-family HTH domain